MRADGRWKLYCRVGTYWPKLDYHMDWSQRILETRRVFFVRIVWARSRYSKGSRSWYEAEEI